MLRLVLGGCAFLLLATSCDRSGPPVDFSFIDSLMIHRQFDRADTLIHAGLARAKDSVTIKKLNHRLRLVNMQKFYAPLYRSVRKGDTATIRLRVNEKIRSLQKKDSSAGRWYLFDSWVLWARLDSLAGKMEKWAESLSRALDFPVPRPYGKIDISLSLAVYAMERERYEEARAHLDNALRRFPKSDLPPELMPVYLSYMNGHFDKAFQQLQRMPEKSLKGRWKAVKIFLQNYRDKLTLKDRFKLW